jgi:REP element-mobilizing transposase RayT
MSNTYTQLHLQLIFAPKYREAMIDLSWKEALHKYITGIFQKNKHKMLQVNTMPDHMHILIGLHPAQSISSITQNVKSESSKWINEKKLTSARFAWQEGYGAFSYSKSHLPQVISYIQRQEQHHQKQTFLDEYKSFLQAFGIEYDDRYIFKEPV